MHFEVARASFAGETPVPPFILRHQLESVLFPLQSLSSSYRKAKWMNFPAVLIIFGVIGFSGNSPAPSGAAKADENDSIFKSYGFPSHAGLKHLCQRRVYGSGSEITWDAFASTAEPSELVDYYFRKLGKSGFTREGKGATWRLPPGDPRPRRVLNIVRVGTDNPSHECEEQPPADSRAVILLSRRN